MAWRSATRITLPYEWFPGDNIPAPVETEVFIAFDDENLYLGFLAYDPSSSSIRANLADRDTPFQDDAVGFMVDPFNDERRRFQFRIKPRGVQMGRGGRLDGGGPGDRQGRGRYHNLVYGADAFVRISPTNTVQAQLLFSYRVNSQTVLFLGYSNYAQGMFTPDMARTDLTRYGRTFFSKLGYAWRP